MTDVLIRRAWTQRHAHREGNVETHRGEDDLKPEATGKQGERPRMDPHHPPNSFRGNMAPATPWPWISSAQNCETINFHCSKSPAVVFCYSNCNKLRSTDARVKSSVVTEPHRAQPQVSLNEGWLSLASLGRDSSCSRDPLRPYGL